jgi:hypothetical protein
VTNHAPQMKNWRNIMALSFVLVMGVASYELRVESSELKVVE